MKLRAALLGLALVASVAPCSAAASAQFYYSGADLFDALRSDSVKQPVGIGYVAGVVDAANGRPTRSGECFQIPEGVAARQLGDAVTRWLDRNPSARADNAAAAVAKALQEAHPCGK